MSYIQTSLSLAVDTETYKFVPLNMLHDVAIQVPVFLWNYSMGTDKVYDKDSRCHLYRIDTMFLNKLAIACCWPKDIEVKANGSISFHDRIGNLVTLPLNTKKAGNKGYYLYEAHPFPQIRFTDPRTGKRRSMTVNSYLAKRPTYPLLSCLHCKLKMATEEKDFAMEQVDVFTKIDDLYQAHPYLFETELVGNYGLSDMYYTVVYNGRPLAGMCYAVVFGAVAILLKDDLSFDALVLLRGTANKLLVVNSVLYTTNEVLQSLCK